MMSGRLIQEEGKVLNTITLEEIPFRFWKRIYEEDLIGSKTYYFMEMDFGSRVR